MCVKLLRQFIGLSSSRSLGIVCCEAKRNPDEYRYVAHFSYSNTDGQIHSTQRYRELEEHGENLCGTLLLIHLCVELYLLNSERNDEECDVPTVIVGDHGKPLLVT